MNIRVKYHNDKYDIVRGFLLDVLLEQNRVKSFYRPSENRWVTVGVDRIRSRAGTGYNGEQRRASDNVLSPSNLFMPPQESAMIFV